VGETLWGPASPKRTGLRSPRGCESPIPSLAPRPILSAVTCPRTVEGKDRSSPNACKHGLPSERPVLPSCRCELLCVDVVRLLSRRTPSSPAAARGLHPVVWQTAVRVGRLP